MQQHKTLERLMLFSEVANLLSFTHAAKNLNISRGHLSQQVASLEKDMGVKLLLRSTRNVKLTAAGEHVMRNMNDIRETLINLQRLAVNEQESASGLIKITSPKQFTERYLLQICAEFRQQHPEIQFAINCSYTNYDLLQQDFDLAFRATSEPPNNLIARKLMNYRQKCVASPSYLEKYGTPKSPEDLQNHQCLSGPDQQVWAFHTGNFQTTGWMTINDNALLKQQALNGFGIILVADYLVDQEIQRGELVELLDTHIQFSSHIYALYPQLIQQPKRIGLFVEFVTNALAKIRS